MVVRLIFLLLLSRTGPAQAEDLRISAFHTLEDYSFADSGSLSWVEASHPGKKKWKHWVRASRVERFGDIDHQGTLGTAYRISDQKGLEFELGYSPGASVFPRFTASGYYYTAYKKVQLIPGYRFSHYGLADVHMLSLAGILPVLKSLEFQPRVILSATDFSNSGSTQYNPALIAAGKYSFSEDYWITLSYIFHRESFEAGAPGQTARFDADTYRAEGEGRIFSDWLYLRASWEYEKRDTGAFVRKTEVGLAGRW